LGRRLTLVACLFALAAGNAQAAGYTKADTTFFMDDGTALAGTLYVPAGTPPAAGWPGIVMFHGLGGTRADTNTVAEQSFAQQGFAILTFDARGHGASGGLFSADGPREIADSRNLFNQFAARPDVDDAHIGAWGISLGGGAIWRSLVEGIPFAAVETVETWTDLYSALIPQDWSKSGAIYGFLSSVPVDRISPDVLTVKDDAFASTNLARLHAFARQRSSLDSLPRITTPALVFQGRRDFAFGLDQGLALYRGLAGPKRLYIGAFGHSPSKFPGPDKAILYAEGGDWFGRYLRGDQNGIDRRPPIELAPDPFREGHNVQYATLPATKLLTFALPGSKRITPAGSVQRSTQAQPVPKLETFGSPIVRVVVKATGGWNRLVAVLTAVSPKGEETVVSEGGTALANGTRTVTIRLISDVTTVARGSRFHLTLAPASTFQSAGNLLYADIPMDLGARVVIGDATLALPVLRKPIS
jgi:predicted acyl esterase